MASNRWQRTGILAVLLSLFLSGIIAVPVNAESRDGAGWSARTGFHVRNAATTAPTGLAPAQIRSAYNLPSTGGTGTIAIIDAYDAPTILNDLTTFSSQFGLPAPNFEKHMMAPSISSNGGWDLEISLDVEWAHAIAPNAKILLVEAPSAGLSDLLSAVDYARGRSDVVAVSMSWGAGEFSGESSYDSHFTSPYGAAFFASSGDSGAGVIWPSASANVTAVGGTTLNYSGSTLVSETAWSGSGGGISAYEPEPSYQSTYGVSGTGGMRAVPDVAYDADPASGVSVYDSTPYSGQTGWFQVGGTSAGAPQWAAIQSLGLNATNANFYTDARSATPSNYFRDITAGSNGYPAGPGYDLVTGLGSPLTTNFAPVTTPDFRLSLSPSSQSFPPGGSTSYTVGITALNGFVGSVGLSVAGLPSGATGSFSANPATTSSTLSVTTLAATTPGTYTLTVTGTSGTLTHTATATLVVTSPGFAISASPSSQTVARGSSTSYYVLVTPQTGFTGSVSLSVSGLPRRTSASFSPNPTTGSSVLTISTNSRTYTGTYTLTITGTSGGITSTTTATLTVTR